MLAACQINSADHCLRCVMAYKCPHAAETPCSFGGELSLTGTSGVRLDGEEAELVNDCIMSASAVKVRLPALL